MVGTDKIDATNRFYNAAELLLMLPLGAILE